MRADIIDIKSVARPTSAKEPDLLHGNEDKPLIVKDLEKVEVMRFTPPDTGWTHDTIEATAIPEHVYFAGCDFYLGDNWIGSTEV